MAEDSKPNAPIEIIIRVDPTAAAQAVKRRASSAWRLATSDSAVECYLIAAVMVAAIILVLTFVALAAEGAISGKVFAVPVAICLWVGVRALKRRYSPLIRD